jgi:iron complex transport system substrate-binding protein
VNALFRKIVLLEIVMPRICVLFFVALWCCLSSALGAGADARAGIGGGHRIVSLSPHATEMLYALGLEKNVVGISEQCDFPSEAKTKPVIGSVTLPSFERIVALSPSYVVGSELNPRTVLEALKKNGVQTRILAPKFVHEIPADIVTLGRELGAGGRAEVLARDFSASLQKYERSALARVQSGKNRIVVLVQVSPPIAAAPRSWLGDIFARGGYENIVKPDAHPWPKLSREFLFSQNPDVVFLDRGALSQNQSEANVVAEIQRLWAGKTTKPRVVFLPRDVLMRPGPRIVEGLRFLQEFR